MFIRDLKLNYKGRKLKLNYERQTFEAEIEDGGLNYFKCGNALKFRRHGYLELGDGN